MSFLMRDPVDYKPILDVTPGSDVTKGEAAVVQDSFGFYFKDADSGDEVTFVIECRQVLATKKTGTGEEISSGEKLYYIVADDAVTSNDPGSGYGTTCYYCGTAIEDASASATTVLMDFDGTRYAEDV
jgi:predicted RecA/RadA family phage recombinase